jgi:hypothetical protein
MLTSATAVFCDFVYFRFYLTVAAFIFPLFLSINPTVFFRVGLTTAPLSFAYFLKVIMLITAAIFAPLISMGIIALEIARAPFLKIGIIVLKIMLAYFLKMRLTILAVAYAVAHFTLRSQTATFLAKELGCGRIFLIAFGTALERGYNNIRHRTYLLCLTPRLLAQRGVSSQSLLYHRNLC